MFAVRYEKKYNCLCPDKNSSGPKILPPPPTNSPASLPVLNCGSLSCHNNESKKDI